LGAYVLIGWSVAGMGWSMVISGDPAASVAMVVSVTGIACAGAVFAYFLYRPLFRATGSAVDIALAEADHVLRRQ
jgi:hypothetical protein